ncbi:hypothetical protein LAZ67_21002631 [Cordylochernes scorpioides]|uniref:Uncharacterized protein n=1 Tax=Cordylochernes scorpioides TaxID=51811 RepID=A0ABY6LMV1_9ARAC|nr:hypothetical protein LAZ67_21002631 [Cordylochernes scorpioides]
MPQPPYSTNLAPCDFFLFPKLKRPMKGRRYPTLNEIKTASKEELKKILKYDFLKRFGNKKNRWHKCMRHLRALHWIRPQQDKIDIDPEQHLYPPKIVDIATAVIEMYGDI